MPFDGRNLTGAPVTPPIYYHPGAPAVGHLLSNTLEQAYYRARKGGRIVGRQTAFLLQRRPKFYMNASLVDWTVADTDFIECARMLRWGSAHATHAYFALRARVAPGGQGGLLKARITVSGTVGATPTTVTGDTEKASVAYPEDLEQASFRYHSSGRGILRQLPVAELVGAVDMSSLDGEEDLTFVVEAFAYGQDGSETDVALGFRQEDVLIWTEAHG